VGENWRMGTAPPRGHREIDHTADLGFEVWAPMPEELFAEAVAGLADLCLDREAVRPVEERSLEASGASPEERLVRWLQEVYFQLERDLWLPCAADRVELDGERVRGTVRGEPFDPERHVLHTEIKAITWHHLAIERDDDGLWRTLVIVDV
jgi:SHS2 domain-containing protein